MFSPKSSSISVYPIYCCRESESYSVVDKVEGIEVGADEKLHRDAPVGAATKKLGKFYASRNDTDADNSSPEGPGTHTPQQPD